MGDLFERSRADRVLRALLEKEPMTMREFTEASRHAPRHARVLFDHLVELNLIRADRLEGYGAHGLLRIRLTAYGRRVAEQLVEIEDIVKEAGRAAERKRA